MTFKGLELDYNEDKARIDASGFDFLQSLKKICAVCGQEIKEDENSKNIEGLEVCEPCLQSLRASCDICGQEIKEDEGSKNIEGLEVCEKCVGEA